MAKKLRIVVSLTTNDNDYQIEQAQSAEQAGNRLGVTVEIIYADNDAINQSTQILKVVQAPAEQRPDAVVFEPVEAQRCHKWRVRRRRRGSAGRC